MKLAVGQAWTDGRATRLIVWKGTETDDGHLFEFVAYRALGVQDESEMTTVLETVFKDWAKTLVTDFWPEYTAAIRVKDFTLPERQRRTGFFQ